MSRKVVNAFSPMDPFEAVLRRRSIVRGAVWSRCRCTVRGWGKWPGAVRQAFGSMAVCAPRPGFRRTEGGRSLSREASHWPPGAYKMETARHDESFS